MSSAPVASRGRSDKRGDAEISRSRSSSREKFGETHEIRTLHSKFVKHTPDRLDGNYPDYTKFFKRFEAGGSFYEECMGLAKLEPSHKRCWHAKWEPELDFLQSGFTTPLLRDLGVIYGVNNVHITWVPGDNSEKKLTVEVTWAEGEASSVAKGDTK